MATSNTEEIRIQVDQETAKAYRDSPEEERRAVSTLLRLWLKGGKPSPESLKRAMGPSCLITRPSSQKLIAKPILF